MNSHVDVYNKPDSSTLYSLDHESLPGVSSTGAWNGSCFFFNWGDRSVSKKTVSTRPFIIHNSRGKYHRNDRTLSAHVKDLTSGCMIDKYNICEFKCT